MIHVASLALPTRSTSTVVEQFLGLVSILLVFLLGLLLPLIILLLLLLVLRDGLKVLEPCEMHITSLTVGNLLSTAQLSCLNVPVRIDRLKLREDATLLHEEIVLLSQVVEDDAVQILQILHGKRR